MIALLHGAPAFGAVERYVAAIVAGLKGRPEEVVLIYPDVPALEPFGRLSGANVRAAPFPSRLAEASVPALVPRLALALRRLRPRVVHVTDVWPAAQIASRVAGVGRLLVTHHTPELPRRDNLAGRLWQWGGWRARPELIYTSEADRATDGRDSAAHVVYLGIDVERFARARPVLAHDGRLVGNVGRLAEQKGQGFLIDAAPRVLERHPDVRFVIVGDGELRTELEQRASSVGIADRFLFTGARDDVPELLASLDVFALPSLFEGLCYAVIEAQAAGVPVVATPVGGVRETVVPGETGVCCVPGDPVSLADGIVWLLEHPEEARRMAGNARSRVAERFSERRMVDETLALYG